MYQVDNQRPLPLKLIRFIFEQVARDDVRSAARLARISHLVQHWIDPILYSDVVLLRQTACRSFLRTIETSKRGASYIVRSLCVSFNPLEVFVPKILLACPALVNLTIYVVHTSLTGVETHISSGNYEKLHFSLSRLRPSQVQMELAAVAGNVYYDPLLPFHKTLFQSTTHLVVIDPWELWTACNFGLLPALTHISFNLELRPFQVGKMSAVLHALDRVFERCARLKICIVRISRPGGVSKDYVQNTFPSVHDPRLVLLYDTEPLFNKSLRLASIWELAESITKERRGQNKKRTMIPEI
ncbi:hypothetical protein BDP27DRAFT_661264 [Rhodocollybia butyracea]|uniref:F-box domain-containing protein n=1 Tax=Rhodocollybia butyracea TaxID=206335 RepID=A0A9P5U8A9_9AGAR|nr:hypothetical protein BDP27DRAFT_661264 [Rhodocollybia butyracea]